MDLRKWFPQSPLFNAMPCVYCGGLADTTDHTPPRCFLPDPLPAELTVMTVPACAKCNVSFSRDEKWAAAIVKTVSFMEADITTVSPGGRVYKQMEKDRRLAEFIRSRLDERGIFNADEPVRNILGRVIAKTAAGLLFHEFGRAVPLSDISIVAMEHARNINPSALAELHRRDDGGWAEVTPSGRVLERQALAALGESPPHLAAWRTYVPGYFEYHFLRRENNTMLTAILLHGALTVLVECPWPSRVGPRRKGTPPHGRRRRKSVPKLRAD